jgi:hypothetical protein
MGDEGLEQTTECTGNTEPPENGAPLYFRTDPPIPDDLAEIAAGWDLLTPEARERVAMLLELEIRQASSRAAQLR